MDLSAFLERRRPRWAELEALLTEIDRSGLRGLDVEAARRFAILYRDVSGDLVKARSLTANPQLLDYLNDLVGRAYSHIYASRRFSLLKLFHFFWRDYPRLVRAEARVILFAAAVFFGGAAFGAAAMALDPAAGVYLLPKQHAHLDPSERVASLEEDMAAGRGMSSQDQAYFSSYLFTHNIQVTFLVFALGFTFGIFTFVTLFYNGLLIGALGWHYVADGVGLFFFAWILPHGVPELTSIFIAGGAGFILGRALWNPGRRSRAASLKLHAGRAVKLILGTAPLLVGAGLIEGTISQMNPPQVPYALKLAVAGVAALLLVAYLGFFGSRAFGAPPEEEP